MKFATTLTLCALISGNAFAVPPPTPHGSVPAERQLKWQELEVYVFCCFTANTSTDKE
jgi:alpha-L-fucosidase